MKTAIAKYAIIAFTAFLAACSGGGSGVSTTTSTQVIPQQADIMFVNVQGDPNKVSLVPGQRDVEVAAFRMSWADQNNRDGISQLVFTSTSSASLWATFKDFKLVDADGKDVGIETLYYVSRNDARHEIIVDFYQYAWRPNDYGVVQKTYSLLASLMPGVPSGTDFAFNLSAVQMHSANMTATSDVVGRNFKVAKVVGVELPIITTTSLSSISVDPSLAGTVVQVGSFDATCPAESSWGCMLSEMTFETWNMSDLVLRANGFFGTAYFGGNGHTYLFPSLGYYMSPGQTTTFTITATANINGALDGYMWISIPNMAWVVGSQQVKVNPVIPTVQDSCSYIISDWSGCKG